MPARDAELFLDTKIGSGRSAILSCFALKERIDERSNSRALREND
jgi:hypothetical protein